MSMHHSHHSDLQSNKVLSGNILSGHFQNNHPIAEEYIPQPLFSYKPSEEEIKNQIGQNGQ